MNLEPKFEAGDLIRSELYPNYYLFVEELNKTSYKVCHCFRPFETDKSIQYSKNAGHDCWMTFNSIENHSTYGKFIKVGKLPLLIGRKYIRIDKTIGGDILNRDKTI